jgi:2'-5' RNA ligase
VSRERGHHDRRNRQREDAEPGRKRLFVALPLDDAAKASISGLADRVRTAVPDADTLRWVRFESLHLTLRFLGSTHESEVPVLTSVIDEIAADATPFDVTVAGAGAFPDLARPRVLWLGVRDGSEAIAALARALNQPLAEAGWAPEERPFRVHLTLARADGVRAGAAVAARLIDEAEDFELRVPADRISLFESHSERGGARYLAIHETPLGRAERAR